MAHRALHCLVLPASSVSPLPLSLPLCMPEPLDCLWLAAMPDLLPLLCLLHSDGPSSPFSPGSHLTHQLVLGHFLMFSECLLQVGIWIWKPRSCCSDLQPTDLSGLTQVYCLVHRSLLQVWVIVLGSSPDWPAWKSYSYHPGIVPSRTFSFPSWCSRREYWRYHAGSIGPGWSYCSHSQSTGLLCYTTCKKVEV